MTPFETPGTPFDTWERSLLKETLWEKEKLLVQEIPLFAIMFSTLSKTEIIFFVTSIFFVCKCFQFGLVPKKIVVRGRIDAIACSQIRTP